ncbi:hypothetical protein E2C01_076424 [Portunus trituberculatus]|uniref:Uncharacterized protein n=1 Tax=Portunus trituberculatus TaxID=210409 RepID=A0A5B7IBI0_PORTR|nr:hypothetical protein [Portunus trituberculatus]
MHQKDRVIHAIQSTNCCYIGLNTFSIRFQEKTQRRATETSCLIFQAKMMTQTLQHKSTQVHMFSRYEYYDYRDVFGVRANMTKTDK